MIIKLKQKSTMSNFTNTVMYEYAKYIFVFSNCGFQKPNMRFEFNIFQFLKINNMQNTYYLENYE